MKKALTIFTLLMAAGNAGRALADSTSTIQLPVSFTSDLIAMVSATISNFSGYVTLIISILLAAVVIEILIDAIRGRH